MLTAQTTWARSTATNAFDVVPFGVSTVVVVNHSGAPLGTRFWKNDFFPAPSGYRSSSTGRPPMARSSGPSTLR